ncbi:uncharacterized protein [Aristolochia californica]|uniref:uncharacterized protein n=1 Tax=Aristolochia californica TaxID=171875 RepID=UPI0035DBA9F7
MFYNGLNGQTRTIVDAASSGTLMSKTVQDATSLLEEMASNNYQWQNERTMAKKFATLSHQISALTTQRTPQSAEYVTTTSMTIPSNEVSQEQVQYINNQNYNYHGNPMPNYYYPRLRNHENLSYRNTKNVLQPPPGFDSQSSEKKMSLEDVMVSFVQETNARFKKTDSRLDTIETHCSNMGATMKNFELQIGQLATTVNAQQREAFPSNTKVNPKEQCKAITLRSGREIERSPSKESKSTPTAANNGQSKNKVEEEEIVNDTLREADMPPAISFPDNPPILSTPLPYPQSFQNKKLDQQFSKFLDIFKKIYINILFANALEQMPNYVKFLKDIIFKKRSIYLMPLSVGRKLGLREIKRTTISLQLAYRSIKCPRGIIEDVLVKVDKFIFPVDFVVLDMDEDEKVPLILRRPFLATGRVLIDVQKGELTLRVNKEEVMFNIYRAMKFPKDPSTCIRVDIIKQCVEEAFQEYMPADHLERCITTSSHAYDFKNSVVCESDLPFVSEEFLHYVFALGAL